MKSRSRSWRSAGVKKARGGEAHWAVSYVDVLTLLLCFFIVFYSAGEKDQKSNVMSVIVGEFGEKSSATPDADPGRGPANESTQKSEKASWMQSLNVVLQENENVEMKTEAETVYVSFRTTEFFAPGKTELTTAGRKVVEKFAKVMTPHKDAVRVAVQGHTDGLKVSPGRHSYKDNWELSVLRATRVLSLLIKKGFDSSALSAEGYADTRSIAAEDLHPRRISFRIEPRLDGPIEKGGRPNEHE
jgi:chemotaxis protein MotB